MILPKFTKLTEGKSKKGGFRKPPKTPKPPIKPPPQKPKK